MQNDTDSRLRRLRGPVQPKRHNARTIAALTSNPGCVRRGLCDAAGVDKGALAERLDFPVRFGQSQFAITRGNAFEAQVKADGCAELVTLLREVLDLDITEVGYTNFDEVGGNDSQDLRHAHSQATLLAAAAGRDNAGTLFDHPLLRLDVAGVGVYLEPDLIAFQHAGIFHVIEIKSFAVIDGQADGGKVASAAIQSAVYVHALRTLLGSDDAVSSDIVLVCPKDFSNRPCATKVDVRKQLIVLQHQLNRLARIEALLDALPIGVSLDLAKDDDGQPVLTRAELVQAMDCIEARYSPECLANCELAFFCRDEATGGTATLGKSVREELGGVELVNVALGLAAGSLAASDEQAEIAALLRAAARIYRESMSPGGGAQAARVAA
ncbi:hypothetical protein ACFQO7_34525 [Catellatospora aurea]|uniref:Secreted protein n=1 Tax=Catellatospora aurea TaxID=1337874 RepID=A0ABW2H5Q9_9ACTN